MIETLSSNNTTVGPDALDVKKRELEDRLSQKRGTLKSGLMDQSLIAGIGNVYSDEILFQLRLHPKAKVDQLDNQTASALHSTIKRVLKTAIKHHADPDEMPASYLLHHRTPLGDCPRCNRSLEKLQVSGRNAIYCPNCQT